MHNSKEIITPVADIARAFGAIGVPMRLTGGEGTSYLVGNIVLKPANSEEEVIWRSEMLSSVKPNGFRFPTPVRTLDNQWTYKGWEAASFLKGKEVKGNWEEKIAVSRKFHSAISTFPKPSFIEKADHPWAIAGRMIWGEDSLRYADRLIGVMSKLKKLYKPITVKNQLIHGDMTGNILFAEQLEPAVIDFSPYWRPTEYATAIIIVDSVVWEGAPDSLLLQIDDSSEMNQLLVRAAMWRIKTTEEYKNRFGKGSLDDVDAYHHFIDLIEHRTL